MRLSSSAEVQGEQDLWCGDGVGARGGGSPQPQSAAGWTPTCTLQRKGPVWGQAWGSMKSASPSLPLCPSQLKAAVGGGAGGCSLLCCPGVSPEGGASPAQLWLLEEESRPAQAVGAGLSDQGLPLSGSGDCSSHWDGAAAPRRCRGVPFTAGIGGGSSPHSLLLMIPPSCLNPHYQHRSV